MKKLLISVVLVMVGLGFGCLERPGGGQRNTSGTLYRHHFVGTIQVARGTNASKFKEILALRTTEELRKDVLGKLAKGPYEIWRKELPPSSSDQSALIHPLLEDLLSAESYLEIRGPTDRSESVLAVELTDERALL